METRSRRGRPPTKRPRPQSVIETTPPVSEVIEPRQGGSQEIERTSGKSVGTQNASPAGSSTDRPQEKRPRLTLRKARTRRASGGRIGALYRMMNHSVNELTVKLSQMNQEIMNTKAAMEAREGRSSSSVDLASSDNQAGSTVNREGEMEKENESSVTPRRIETRALTNEECRNITYNVRNLNLEKPKFGNKPSDQPVTFLEDLEIYLKKTSKEGKEIDLVLECLTDDARDWARIYKKRWVTIEDFKVDFLATYWGENDQSELRRNIVQGCWDKQKNPSMLNYFLRIAGRAQMLNYKIPEKQLVEDVIRHYPKYVQQVWVIAKVDTIQGMAEFLRNMDTIGKQEAHNYSTSNQATGVEKKIREHQQKFQRWQKPQSSQKKTTINTIEGEQAKEKVDQDIALN